MVDYLTNRHRICYYKFVVLVCVMTYSMLGVNKQLV